MNKPNESLDIPYESLDKPNESSDKPEKTAVELTFGRSPLVSNPFVGEAIQRLRATEEELMLIQDFLQKKIECEMVLARDLVRTNAKSNALEALKKKKCHEKDLQKINGILPTITAALQTMESTEGTLKNAYKDLSGDVSDPADSQNFDMDELEAELNELQIKGDMEEQQKLEAKLQTTREAAAEVKAIVEAQSKALLEAEAAEEQARLESEAAKAETKTTAEAKELIREDIQNLEEQQNLEAEVLEVGVTDELSETPPEKPAAHGDDVAGPCRPI